MFCEALPPGGKGTQTGAIVTDQGPFEPISKAGPVREDKDMHFVIHHKCFNVFEENPAFHSYRLHKTLSKSVPQT